MIFDDKDKFFMVQKHTIKSQYDNILAAIHVMSSILITSVEKNNENILFIEWLKSISSGLTNQT